ncbi:MAG: hypothetical protein ABIH72_04575 [archaeon]
MENSGNYKGSWKMSWAELQLEISKLHRTPHMEKLYKIITEPITAKSVRGLVDSGWFVFPLASSHCLPDSKLITLVYDADSYTTDKELCHEVVHAVYDFLPDHITSMHSHEEIINNRIAEWVGRQIRASPVILRSIKSGFELKPEIYDRASELAFGNGNYRFSETFMD